MHGETDGHRGTLLDGKIDRWVLKWKAGYVFVWVGTNLEEWMDGNFAR